MRAAAKIKTQKEVLSPRENEAATSLRSKQNIPIFSLTKKKETNKRERGDQSGVVEQGVGRKKAQQTAYSNPPRKRQ